jgi:bacitracin synthase 3
LFKLSIVEIAKSNYILMVDMHHIITDGVSSEIIIKDFIQLYNNDILSPVRVRYKDYSEFQNDRKQQELILNQKQWWLNTFKSEVTPLNLPYDFKRPHIMTYEGDTINFSLANEVSQHLKNIANEEKVTLFMVILSIYNILFSKLCNTYDIVIGTPVVGRNHIDLEQTLGMFVNTIALRNYLQSDLIYSSFLSQIKNNVLQAFDNQDFQFEDLINELKVTRDMSRHPLIDVMFSLNNIDKQKSKISDLFIEPIYDDSKVTKFDLNLNCYSSENELKFSLSYYNRVFEKRSIEKIIGYFTNIINIIISNRNIKLCDIEILSIEEKQQLLIEFNNTTIDYPKTKSIPQLFDEQVNKCPDNVVLVFNKKAITYKELNEKSNQLARYLINNGTLSNSVISLLFVPSFDMLIGIMGVLKAGGIYLPISPELPSDRILYMMNDSCSDIVLTHNLVNFDRSIRVNIVDVDNTIISSFKVNSIDNKNDIESAYIIYTSGTTGKPKGVLINHKNLVNYFSWFSKTSKLNENDRTVLVTSYAFDLGYTGLYSSILNGCQLHLLSRDIYLSPNIFLDYIIRNRISYLKLTSSLYSLLITEDNFEEALKGIKLLVLGGEEINIDAVIKSLSLYNELKVINHYGPTESTIGCVTFEINKSNINHFKVKPVIGKPIDNTSVYILNDNGQILPFNISGELCISGEGLADGYVNNPELTLKKFIDHPFKPDKKLYRTGDLARRLPDGNIEFLGRIDHQIKIRGFRVELEEIENCLLKHKNIKKSLVIVMDNVGVKHLCAYVVCNEEFDHKEIRNYLKNLLPDYMIPSYFMEMDEIPLTNNGKINRKALPAPIIKAGKDYIGPSTDMERKLLKIWSEILGLNENDISIDSNFFEIGGNSISLLTVISKVRKDCCIDISLGELMSLPTIQSISKFLNQPKEDTDHLKTKAKESVNIKRETLDLLIKRNK